MSFSAFSSKTRRLVVSIVHRRAYLDSTQAVILADTFKVRKMRMYIHTFGASVSKRSAITQLALFS